VGKRGKGLFGKKEDECWEGPGGGARAVLKKGRVERPRECLGGRFEFLVIDVPGRAERRGRKIGRPHQEGPMESLKKPYTRQFGVYCKQPSKRGSHEFPKRNRKHNLHTNAVVVPSTDQIRRRERFVKGGKGD